MILVKDDIHKEGYGPVPLTLPLDERVLQVELRLPSMERAEVMNVHAPQVELLLPSRERAEVMNVHAPNPAADRKVFWEELACLAHAAACLMAGDMNSLSDVHDANYTPVWSENEKTAMRPEQALEDDWELQDAWPLLRASDESREGYTHTHFQPGGGVRRRIDRPYVPLRWVEAMMQVQVVQLGLSEQQAVMAVFTPEYLQMLPRARIPTWMAEDRELMEAWA